MEAGIPIITVLQGKINAVFVISKHFRPVLNHLICWTSKFFRLGSDHLCGILIISVIDHRNAGNNNASLLPGNLSYRISQKLHVIQTDGSDHAGYRILHCRSCIQSSPKSCLQSHIIHTSLSEDHHSHKEQHLKISRMVASLCHQLICQRLHSLKSLQKCLILNIHLIDLKTFINLHQMGRGKQSAGIPCLPENRSQERTGASLPIGSRNMYHLKFLLWIPQSPQTFSGMLQTVLRRKLRSLLNISNRFLVIHTLQPPFLSIVFLYVKSLHLCTMHIRNYSTII